MRTALIPLFASLAFAAGCNSFSTVEEACLEKSPGEDFITSAVDKALFNRMNCYRRLSKRTKAPVNSAVQEAVEGHGLWIESNGPRPQSLANQAAGTQNFTGVRGVERLENATYLFPLNTELLELYTWEEGVFAGLFEGADRFDYWFDDPFLRPGFLQSTITAAGVHEGTYELVFPEETQVPNLPISYQYWNLLYSIPPTPYAEPPAAYPRNGQTGVPPIYVHLSGSQALELGRTYGYPITFTVGSRETGVTVTQASFRDAAGNELPFSVLTGDDAVTALRLRNSAIVVPDQPLQPGQEYQVDIRIKTDQGERRATTRFTTGTESREIPAGILQRVIENDMPLIWWESSKVIDGELVHEY